MTPSGPLSLFFASAPGLEPALEAELAALGLAGLKRAAGGVEAEGDMADLARAHLWCRGAGRILLRLGEARVTHLAQLDKWARKLPWRGFLRDGQRIEVEASCKRSKLYHSGAVAERVATAARAALGEPRAEAEPVRVLTRLEKDLCTVSLDASGEPLHRRGFKQETGKAPLRETLAAMFLAECGYRGEEPALDPMCGSGTFVIEAAEIAARLAPGRSRDFSFMRFSGFDAEIWAGLKAEAAAFTRAPLCRSYGFDRDSGAVAAAAANAERAGVAEFAAFRAQPISDLARPDGPPGLVMVNPPYGERIGEKSGLRALYGALGAVLQERFSGWRVGLVTSEPALARATGLPFLPPGPPIPHGPLKIRLYRTEALDQA